MKTVLFSLVAFQLALAAHAAAQSAVVLPAIAEPGVPNTLAQQASPALEQALQAAMWTISSRRDIAALQCDDSECASQAATRSGAEYAVRTKLFHSLRDAVAVIAVSPDGATYVADEEVGESLTAAVRRATTTITTQIARGVGPFLSVTGKPHGAAVRIDGKVVGAMPLELLRVSPGMHLLIVEAPAHTPLNKTIIVDETAGTLVTVDDVDLGSAELPPAQEPSRASALGPRRWLILGAIATGLGVALAGPSLRAVLRDGDCRDCSEARREVAVAEPSLPAAKAGLAAGAALASVGIGVLIWGGVMLRNQRIGIDVSFGRVSLRRSF